MAPPEARLRDSSDEELLKRLRAGDERGVEELVSRYAGMVYRLALRLTGSPEDAEEVTWEVMQTVWRKISGFRGDSKLSSWIYRIAANAAYGKLRARPVSAVLLEDTLPHNRAEVQPWGGSLRDWSALLEDPAVQAELRIMIETAIAKLPLEYRIAIVLHDVEGLPNVEVANLLGHSLPAVKSRVHRARLALRARLNRYFEQRGER